MIRIDLHTHSIASYDGGLKDHDYRRIFESGTLDVCAITDHGAIDFAQRIKRDPSLKNNIIVGQEIMTDAGEIIGLFLRNRIPDGLSVTDTVTAIQKQHGFVLIPHPEDPHRHGLSIEAMDTIVADIDAIEALNGRQIGRPKLDVRHWARSHNIPVIAASDAHSFAGLGRTCTQVSGLPNNSRELRRLLEDKTKLFYESPPLRAYAAPKLNRLLNRFR